MNTRGNKNSHRRWLSVIALSAGALSIVGCTSLSMGVTGNRYANSTPLPSEKIFLGSDTITIRGIGARRTRELDRYTCGSRGMMVCDMVASFSQCTCYRK